MQKTYLILSSLCVALPLAQVSADLSAAASPLHNQKQHLPHNNKSSVASVTNFGFENGFTGWQASGEAIVTASELYRDIGGGQPQYWTPTQGDYFASLWSTDSNGTDQSTLTQSFNAVAGEVLTFDYFFDFGDVFAFGPDTAVAQLHYNGETHVLFEHNTVGHEIDDFANVDWSTVSFNLPATTVYELEFVVSDANSVFESILGVDNVLVIPAPGAVLLGLIGLSGIGLFKRSTYRS